jgi:hypothetical protein
VGGKILVRRSEFEAWIAAYRQVRDAAIERIVGEVLGELHDRPDAERYAALRLEALR